ncbi:hypothetical protein A9Q84_19510 [Halobacteriovorax marinus]|uniref:Outer membrane protein n=1 Tax=Halobacteriovorax marinus TaxID=97084 RepID=A0A1Y5F2I9_9BACT|nr:hypothetical protein A9Q84_19510 [Halobacteriovorax marinus]
MIRVKNLGLKSYILPLLLLAFSANSLAIDFEDAVFPELASSARALAMGNAYIAKVDDVAAVYYNPAGLGTVRKTHFHISNFHFELNKGWLDIATKGSVGTMASNFMDGFDLNGQRKLLLNNKGTISHQRFNFLPNFTTRYFSIGYLLSKRTRSTIGNETDAKFEYADRRDHGPYVALNLSLFGGVFKMGGSATYLNRKELQGERDANTEFAITSSDEKKGSAVIVVAGTKLTLPITFLPTFSAKMNNALQQKFSVGSTAGAPNDIKNSIDLGFSLTPQIGKVVRMHLEINYKDFAGKYSGISTNRKITLGMELDFARTFFIRAGYGDGWGSGGIGIKSQTLEFDLTTYAVDTTTNEFRGKEDRRFAVSISYGF